MERIKETIEIYNICTCGKTLHSINEGKRGLCSSCWFKTLGDTTKTAFKNLISATFKSITDEEKQKLVNNAFKAIQNETNTNNNI